jgi:hypothetical protein
VSRQVEQARSSTSRAATSHVTGWSHHIPPTSVRNLRHTMSAESIARWNAIPMTRPDHDGLSTQFASAKVLLVLSPPSSFLSRYYPVPLCFPSSDAETMTMTWTPIEMEMTNVVRT